MANLFVALLVFAITFPAFAADSSTKLRARLSPPSTSPEFPLASGDVKWEKKGSRLKFSSSVQDFGTARSVQVFVNGSPVGGVVLAGVGATDILDLDTGEGDSGIPTSLSAGNPVEIRESGVVLLSGTLQTD